MNLVQITDDNRTFLFFLRTLLNFFKRGAETEWFRARSQEVISHLFYDQRGETVVVPKDLDGSQNLSSFDIWRLVVLTSFVVGAARTFRILFFRWYAQHDLVSFKLLVRKVVGLQKSYELSCGVALLFRTIFTHWLVASVCQATRDVLGDWLERNWFLSSLHAALQLFQSALRLIAHRWIDLISRQYRQTLDPWATPRCKAPCCGLVSQERKHSFILH
jgi:hypothetical protein